MMKVKKRIVIIFLVILWFGVIGLGEWVLLNYEQTAGPVFETPQVWPAETAIPRDTDQSTFLMFAHPHCPCTRASIEELSRLMARVQGKLRGFVLFFQPKGLGEEWVESDLWKTASKIPGIQVMIDQDGQESRRFGAGTSGQALLYDAEGRLVFTGGITTSRGHSGDNYGRAAIESFVLEGTLKRGETPVFGCFLNQQDIGLLPRIIQQWKDLRGFCPAKNQ